MEKVSINQNQLTVIQPNRHYVILIINQLSFSQFVDVRLWIKKNIYTHLILPYTYPSQRLTIWLKNEDLIKDKKLKNEFYDFVFNPFMWLMESGHHDYFLEYILGNSSNIRTEYLFEHETTKPKHGRFCNWKISRGNVFYSNREKSLCFLKFSEITSEQHPKSLLLNRMDVIQFFSPNGNPKPQNNNTHSIKSNFHLSYVVEPQIPMLFVKRI